MKYMLAWVKSKRDVQMRADFHSSGFNAPRRTYNNCIVRAYKHTRTHTHAQTVRIHSSMRAHDIYYIRDAIHPSRKNYNMPYILYTIRYVYIFLCERLLVVFFLGVDVAVAVAVNIKHT